MLVFLDESYKRDKAGVLRHALAGFGIREQQYRRLMAALHQCKLEYFRSAAGLTPAEIHELRATRIVVAGPAEDAEVKAVKLLTAKQARHHAAHGDAPGILVVDRLLTALGALDATVFGVLSNGFTHEELHGAENYLPVHHQRLLERVDLWMREQYPDEAAIIVPDTVHHQIDWQLSKRIAHFLFRSNEGQRMRHLVPNPFWVDSSSTPGSQLADIIAHLLMNGMQPQQERKPLDQLWRKVVALEFRSVNLSTRGIRRINKKQQTGAKAH